MGEQIFSRAGFAIRLTIARGEKVGESAAKRGNSLIDARRELFDIADLLFDKDSVSIFRFCSQD